MKSSISLSIALPGLAAAFPAMLVQMAQESGKIMPRQGFVTPVLNELVPFDAESQLVDVTGEHEFNPPGPTDQRGPCPGLNAMANHGYLPHNGIATIDQFITGTNKVFGMGVDLGLILGVYGAVFNGDLTKWSIGGPDGRVGGLLDLLGTPQGISGSHNNYENDGSPTRGDLYQYGNGFKLQMNQFQRLYDMGKAEDNYDLELLTEYRAERFQEGIDNNPYFFYAPFSGVIANAAAWSFVYRFMSNKSEEYPEGRLDGLNLKSFYAITGEDGDFTYTEGHERIPENWYTRNALDQYTVPFLSLDTNIMLLQHLEFASIGGNTGKTNSFVGVNPTDLTSNVYSLDNLAQGDNLMCYGLQLTLQMTPDILSGLFTDINAAMDKIGTTLNDATNSLGCPQLNNIDKTQFDIYPGYSSKYDGYKPPTNKGIVGGLVDLLKGN